MKNRLSLILFFLFAEAFVFSQQPYVLLDTKTDHSSSVEIIVISPDGKYMLSGDAAGFVFIWDLSSMQVIQKIRAHQRSVNSILFNTKGDKFVTSGDDGKVKVFALSSLNLLYTISAPYDRINFAVLTPDDKDVYFGGYAIQSSGLFTGLLKASLSNTANVKTIYSPNTLTTNYGITDGVLDFSNQYIMFSMGYGVMIWDYRMDNLVDALWTGFYVNNITSIKDWIYGWCDGRVIRWKWDGSQYKFNKSISVANTDGRGYSRIVFNSDKSLFLSGDESERVSIYNAESMTLQQVLLGHKDIVRSFQFWNNDSIIFTAGYDHAIKIWSIPKSEKDSLQTDINTNIDTIVDSPIIIDTLTQVKDNRPNVVFSDNNIPTDVGGRTVQKVGDFTVSQEEFEIEIWDNSVYDGDTISLNINGEWVLENYEVTKEKKRIKIKVLPNTNNYLILYAHNLGRISPNTAAIAVIEPNGSKRRLTITSDLEKCGALNFQYKPEN